MTGRAGGLVLVACVAAGVAALLLFAQVDPAGNSLPDGRSDGSRFVVRATDVPESAWRPNGPTRVHTIEYVDGPVTCEVAKYEVYTREVDAAVSASGGKEFELIDSLLTPRRGVVLYHQSLMVNVVMFDREQGRRSQACRVTWCGPTNEIRTTRIIDDAQGPRVEIVRDSDGRTDVFLIRVVAQDDPGRDKLECRRQPQSD